MTKSIREKFSSTWVFGALLLASASIFAPLASNGQTGDNAIYTGSSSFSSSAAFVDASVFSGTDFCTKVYNAISGHPAGTVIDARGITGTLTCANTPWWNGTTALVTPTTILLPSQTISVSTTWYIPNFTKISGAGSSTVIKAATGFKQPSGLNYNSNAIIEMGYDYNTSSPECSPYGGLTACTCGTP